MSTVAGHWYVPGHRPRDGRAGKLAPGHAELYGQHLAGFRGKAIPASRPKARYVVGAGSAGGQRGEVAERRAHELGAESVRGDLDDLDALRTASQAADGVVHLAFRHEAMQTGDLAGAADTDLGALRAIGEALAGTGKPLVGTSGTGLLARAPGSAAPAPRGTRCRTATASTRRTS